MGKQGHPMVDALKAEAQRNPVFRDICYMWSQRQRTRGRLTVTRIKQAMEQEGFTSYTRKQYEEVLRFLSNIGLGTLETSIRGKPKVLNGVKIKLQSVGQAALNGSTELDRRTEVNRYEELVPAAITEQNNMHHKIIHDMPEEKAAPKQRTKAKRAPVNATPAPSQSGTAGSPVQVRQQQIPISVTMVIDGKILNIPLNQVVTSDNFSEVIAKLHKLNKPDVEL